VSAALISQILSASSASGARGAATLLVMAVAGWLGWLDLPEQIEILGTIPAIAVLTALVVVEELVEGDEDLQELLELGGYALRAGAGAFVAWSVAAGADAGVAEAAAPVGGAVLGAGTHHMRARLHESVRGFGDTALSPRTWLLWLERGGLVGVLVAVILAPVVALVFVVLAGIAAGIALLVRRQLERTVFRRECPSCSHPARKEASRCPSCSGALEVERWKAPDPSSTAARIARVLG